MLEFSLKNFKFLCDQNTLLQERIKQEERQRSEQFKDIERLKNEITSKNKQLYKQEFEIKDFQQRDMIQKEELQKLKDTLKKCTCTNKSLTQNEYQNQQLQIQNCDFVIDYPKMTNQAEKNNQHLKSASIQLFDTNALGQRMEGPNTKLNSSLMYRPNMHQTIKQTEYSPFQPQYTVQDNELQSQCGMGVQTATDNTKVGSSLPYQVNQNVTNDANVQKNSYQNQKLNEVKNTPLNIKDLDFQKNNEIQISQCTANKFEQYDNERNSKADNIQKLIIENTQKSQMGEIKKQEQRFNQPSEQLPPYQLQLQAQNQSKGFPPSVLPETGKKVTSNPSSLTGQNSKNNQQSIACAPPSLRNPHNRSGSCYQGSSQTTQQSYSFHTNSNTTVNQQSGYSQLTQLKQTLYSNQNATHSRKSSYQALNTKKPIDNTLQFNQVNIQDHTQQNSTQISIQAKRSAQQSGNNTASQSLTSSINGSTINIVSNSNHFKNLNKIKGKEQTQIQNQSNQNNYTISSTSNDKENYGCNTGFQNLQSTQQLKKQNSEIAQPSFQPMSENASQKSLKLTQSRRTIFSSNLQQDSSFSQAEEGINTLSSKSRGKSQTNFTSCYNNLIDGQGKQLVVKQIALNSSSVTTPVSNSRTTVYHSKTSSLTNSNSTLGLINQQNFKGNKLQKQSSNIILNTEPHQLNMNSISFQTDRLLTLNNNNNTSSTYGASQTFKTLGGINIDEENFGGARKEQKEGDYPLSQNDDEDEFEKERSYKKMQLLKINRENQKMNEKFFQEAEDFNIIDDTDEQGEDKVKFTHMNIDRQKTNLLTYFTGQDESVQLQSNSTINDIPKERTFRDDFNTNRGDSTGRTCKLNDLMGQKNQYQLYSEIKKEEPINKPIHNNNILGETVQNRQIHKDIVIPTNMINLSTTQNQFVSTSFVKSPTRVQNYVIAGSSKNIYQNTVTGEENYLTQADPQPIINCNYFSNKAKESNEYIDSAIFNFHSNTSQINFEPSQEIKNSNKFQQVQSPNKQQVQSQINCMNNQSNNVNLGTLNNKNNISGQISQSTNHQNLELKVKSKSSGNLNKEPGRIKQNLENTNYQKLNPCPSSILQSTSQSTNIAQNSQTQVFKITPTLSYTKTASIPQKQQQDQIGDKIFEQFAIYGIDKAELDQKSPQIQLYPDKQILDNNRESVLPFFAFPKGVETQRFKMTDSLSQINEIMFANYVVENNENCFTFVVKTDDSFKKQQNFQKSNQLLDICNPSRLLYGICFKLKDIIEDEKNKDNLVKTLANGHNFWVTKRAICFLTYYPFVKFFLDIISSFLNQLKMERISFYTQNHESIKRDSHLLAKIEQQYFMKLIQNQFTGLLQELQSLSTPSINQTVHLSYKAERFVYYVPGQQSAKYIEAEGSSSIVFSCIAYETFVEIFFNILIEQPIVFVSTNPALLSSVILMFYSLLKPFKWPHPLISILPQNLIHLLDSPIPIFVGLNMSKQEVVEQDLCQKHEQCTFVFLDDCLVEVSSTTNEIKELILKSTLYNKLLSQTSKLYNNILPENLRRNQLHYQIFQSNLSSNINIQDKKKQMKPAFSTLNFQSNDLKFSKSTGLASSSSNGQMTISSSNSDLTMSNNLNQAIPLKKELLISPNDDQKQACLNLIVTISQFLQAEILDHLPNKHLVAKGDVINLELLEQYINCQRKIQDELVSRIIRTQMFSFFVEEYYYQKSL